MSGNILKSAVRKRQACELARRVYQRGQKPDSLLTVSEWADRYRSLSQKAASEPGRWRTSRAPYLREIMDCLSSSSPINRVVLMKGAQLGGTEAGNNWIGYVIHQAPGPMMAVQPTVETAKRNSKQRIAPLIEESSSLRGLVKDARSRDSGNTVLSKEFPGGVLVMTGANSAVGLRSMPARYLFLDEVDGYPGDVEGEGDPIALAEARSRTFNRRKILMVSTPTIQGVSRIEREYEASDQRKYFCPCPECGEFQTLRFEQLKWDKGNPRSARYICQACGSVLGDEHKTEMLARGEWRATSPGEGKAAGFHLSSLYSPVGWLSWVEIAASWEAAQGDVDLLKSFVNTILGETWQDRGEAPDWERLYERREDYASVPAGGLVLTGMADVQKDRIEVSVWAWGRNAESWLVEHRVLMGDTSREDVWRDLGAMLVETWPHAGGAQLHLSRFGIDAGYATQEVYVWARRQRPGLVMPLKGVHQSQVAIGVPTAVDMTIGGKKLRRSIRLWPVGVSILKSELYGWLRQAGPEDGSPSPRGYVHLPKSIDAEYCQQLCAEHLVTHKTGRREWQKLRERNEALDCRVGARAVAIASQIDRLTESRWAQIEQTLITVKKRDEPPENLHTDRRPQASYSMASDVPPEAPQRRRLIPSRFLNGESD